MGQCMAPSAAGTLRLALTETDLNWGASGPLTLNGGIGGTTDGNVSFALLADDVVHDVNQGGRETGEDSHVEQPGTEGVFPQGVRSTIVR